MNLREAVGESRAQLQQKTPAFWRCQYRRTTTKTAAVVEWSRLEPRKQARYSVTTSHTSYRSCLCCAWCCRLVTRSRGKQGYVNMKASRRKLSSCQLEERLDMVYPNSHCHGDKEV
ncbi:mCG147755 [Mus musculus]|nr:mCG147755 [Mus musculus]